MLDEILFLPIDSWTATTVNINIMSRHSNVDMCCTVRLLTSIHHAFYNIEKLDLIFMLKYSLSGLHMLDLNSICTYIPLPIHVYDYLSPL